MKLVVGTESTWSLRAWLCLKLAQQPFDTQVINLQSSHFKTELAQVSDSGLVPVLQKNDLHIHDSLAIAEYANELSAGHLWPRKIGERARARSICAEVHSGFVQIRQQCPFSSQPVVAVAVSPEMKAELKRLQQIFSGAQGSFYFTEPGIVDAFLAVTAYRLWSYGLLLQGTAETYQRALIDWSLFKQALLEVRQWKRQV